MSDPAQSDAESPAPPVPYMARTHAYYEAQGFEKPYRYAQHTDAPFSRLRKPISQCTVGLVTTASLYPRAKLDPRKVDSGSTLEGPVPLYTGDLAWDKQATHTDDPNSFCPIETLHTLVEESRIGALAPRFHCAPTEFSQRFTNEHDAPELLRRLREDGAEVALLVPL